MNKAKLLPYSLILASLIMVSCGSNEESSLSLDDTTTQSEIENSSSIDAEQKEDYKYADNMGYETKNVNIYRQKGIVDKTFPVRFYEDTPNIPYVDAYEYYKEFFGEEYTLTKDNFFYTIGDESGYIKFDIKSDIFYTSNIDTFSKSDFYVESTTKKYVDIKEETSDNIIEKIVNLKQYNIDIHGDDNLYVPLTFLSSFSGSGMLVNIAYNTKDIFVIDKENRLGNEEKRTEDYFGSDYLDIINDHSIKRPKDLIEYNYGQLCFNFDVLRGYTSQLVFIDNNLLSLGLNGLLEIHYPKIKELLLDEDKNNYFLGCILLFAGLYDGGHTGLSFLPNILNGTKIDDKYKNLYNEFVSRVTDKNQSKSLIKEAREKIIGKIENEYGFNYLYDKATKTATISFDKFVVDYTAWDEYYKDVSDSSKIPLETDTYAFVRQSFYMAKEDGAENLVLDLSANGGGQSDAVHGIVGLFNNAISELAINTTINKMRTTEKGLVDINLDGQYDEKDIEEASKFDFNYAVITTKVAFSCGNLLPSILKELGIKIVGQRSGGGSCAISFVSTAEGLLFLMSNTHCLSNAAGENIDSGVPLDYEINVKDDEGNIDYTKLYTFNFKEYFESLE